MKQLFILLLAAISMAQAADTVPTCSAQIVANTTTPTETDLVITISNPSKAPISLLIPNEVEDQFAMLSIKVKKSDGTSVEESDKAKAINASETSSGSSTAKTIAAGKKHEIVIPISEYFVLPVQAGYTVTAVADNLVGVGGKVVPVNFTATKADE